MVLYDTWQQVLKNHADSVAIRLPASEQSLLFSHLQQAVDAEPELKKGMLHVVRAIDGVVPFVIQTLRAWRDEAVLCPVESEAPVLKVDTVFPDGIIHLKFTSGTTGAPRAVMFKAEQLAADATHIRASMGLRNDQPNVAVISLAHSYGFSNLVLPLLLQGQPMIIAADVLPASLRMAFQNETAVTLPAVPAMWRAWFRTGVLTGSPVKLAISAGSPLPLDLEQQVFNETGLKIHNFLGSSECGAIAYDSSETPRLDASFVGSAITGVQLSINKAGRLVAEGPSVAEGYFQATEEDAEVLSDRCFTTSDLAEITEGQVRMLGRASDTINLAGRKLDPAEVEAALLKNPDILHCVVFGIPSKDEARCEETIACIRTSHPLSTVDINRGIADHLSVWKRPRHYWFRDDLAPNERGKIPRREWREKWLKQHKIDTPTARNLVAEGRAS